MLYLDYSREPGEWVPNVHGGRENLEAVAFLRGMNTRVYGAQPGIVTVAEESTAWPQVSRPVDHGGLGFGYKWNMGWMHDTLATSRAIPIHRRYHHNDLTFGLLYAFTENFILPLSHDEVVHGKGSLLGKMPGDRWQKFANLRAYLAFMWTHPGKKLLFMGGEFAQEREWNHDHALDWHLLADPSHRGVQNLVRDLNRLYRRCRPCTSSIASPAASSGSMRNDAAQSVLAFLRRGRTGDAARPRRLQLHAGRPPRLPCRRAGRRALDRTPEHRRRRLRRLQCRECRRPSWQLTRPDHGRPYSLELTLPPLATSCSSMEAGSFMSRPVCDVERRLALSAGRDAGTAPAQLRAVFGQCRRGSSSACSTPTGGRELDRVDAAGIHRRGLARLLPDVAARASSTAIGSTGPMTRRTGIGSIRTSCCSIPTPGAARARSSWNDALFGYRVGSPDADLSFDRRDSAPVMPKCVVVEPARWHLGRERASAARRWPRDDHLRGARQRLYGPPAGHSER